MKYMRRHPFKDQWDSPPTPAMVTFKGQLSMTMPIYLWYFKAVCISWRSQSLVPAGRGSCPGRYMGGKRGIALGRGIDMLAVVDHSKWIDWSWTKGQFLVNRRAAGVEKDEKEIVGKTNRMIKYVVKNDKSIRVESTDFFGSVLYLLFLL